MDFSWVTDVLSWIIGLVVQIFIDIFELQMDLVLWIVDQFLGLVSTIIGELPPIPGVEMVSGLFAQIPQEWWYLVYRLGIPECIGLYVGALGIRLLLQLIPAVRLGA